MSTNIFSLPLPFGEPKEGRRYVSVDQILYVQDNIYTTTFNLADVGLSQIRGIIVDNSKNNYAALLTVQDTNYSIMVPPLSQYKGPLYTAGLNFVIQAMGSGTTVPINMKFLNFEPEREITYKKDTRAGIDHVNSTGNIINGTMSTAVWQQILPPNDLRYGIAVNFVPALVTCDCYLGWGSPDGTVFGNTWFWGQLPTGSAPFVLGYRQFADEASPIMKTSLWAFSRGANTLITGDEYGYGF